MRSWLALGLLLALVPGTFGGLAFGDLQFNPQLNGTGVVGSTGPFYVSGTPSWLNDKNQLVSLTSPIEGVPGFAQFRGFVDSAAYSIAPGVVGFAYRIRLANNSADRLVRASLGGDWRELDIPLAGADGSGVSATLTGAGPRWTNGNPYLIERATDNGMPLWAFRFGPHGTAINRNQQSAWVWFETNSEGFNQDSITLQDGGAVGAARIISVPEPTAFLILIPLGVLLFGFGRGRSV